MTEGRRGNESDRGNEGGGITLPTIDVDGATRGPGRLVSL